MTYEIDDQTLVDVLHARTSSHQGITFIEGQGKHERIGFSQLLQRAKQRLGSFQAAGVKPGHHMIIQSSDNALFLEALWACLLGGIVAVPVAGGNSSEHRLKLFRIARMLDDAALFTDEKNLQRVQQFADANDLSTDYVTLTHRCCLSEATAADGNAAVFAEPQADDIAFIQFSSGSTSTPKGIVLTHRNLMTNTRSIIDGCLMTPQDHLLSWMPLTHDMGLIGFHLTPLVCDTSHSLMPTDLFVRRPGLWLSETQTMQATILCSPNFGYQHLLKSFKADRHAGLDLSSVRLLFNGAEPISVALCHEFMQTMKPYALDGNAMIPVYGLAEASLAVTFPSLEKRFTALLLDRYSLGIGESVRIITADDGNRDAVVQLLSVGRPVSHVEVSIRDESHISCAELTTGRICIRGPNVTGGYYKEPELNSQMIDADGWLDTGDLGFMHEGELYIAGRAKDIIFINGQNVYPHDLEEILVQESLLERGKLAIASQADADTGAEQLLVFVLHRAELSELGLLARDITRTLGTQAGFGVDAVVAVPRIPKTTSGKIQRFELLRNYRAGEYQALRQEPADRVIVQVGDGASSGDQPSLAEPGSTAISTAEHLLSMCNLHIEGMQLGPDDNLFDLGISSLTLAEIHASIEDTWPDQVDITDLFDYPTVSELAAFLDNKI
ncbi:MAG: AMP-binding protein [Granulosicoccus sp.]